MLALLGGRITIDIDADNMKRIQRAAGQTKKSPAVQTALRGSLKRREREDFIARALSGKTGYPLTNEELEARDVDEAH